jgi:hypothetical protein
MPAGTLPPSSFGVECPWRRGLQTFPLQSLQPARPRPAQAGHPGGSIHKSPRRKSGDSAWLRIPFTMQTGLAQWTGVPSLALRACMGVTRSRGRRRDGGSVHKSPRRKSGDSAWLRIPSTMQTGLAQWTGVPSLALRACMGVTRSRSRRRDGGDGAKHSPSLALRACMRVTRSRGRQHYRAAWSWSWPWSSW